MKKLLIIFAASILGMVACNELEVATQNPQSDNSAIKALSQSHIDNIGVLHNLYLTEAVSNVDFNASNILEEIHNAFLPINSHGLGLSISEKECILNRSYDYSFVSNHLSTSAIIIIDASINYVENTSSFTYSDLQNQIVAWEASANSNLNGEELDAVLIYFSVLENSAAFWMPIDLGGTGEGTPMAPALWKKCLVADCLGAVGAFLEIGFALCATPVTLSALACVVGYTAAFSSMCAIFW